MLFSTIIAAAIAIAATNAKPQATPTPCTTTIESFVSIDLSPVTTVYLTTYTATSSVDCHGCSLTIKEVGGPGPVRRVTSTVTDDETTTTTTVCSVTPTVVN